MNEVLGGPAEDLQPPSGGGDRLFGRAPDVGRGTHRGGAVADRINSAANMPGLSDLGLHFDRLIQNRAT